MTDRTISASVSVPGKPAIEPTMQLPFVWRDGYLGPVWLRTTEQRDVCLVPGPDPKFITGNITRCATPDSTAWAMRLGDDEVVHLFNFTKLQP